MIAARSSVPISATAEGSVSIIRSAGAGKTIMESHAKMNTVPIIAIIKASAGTASASATRASPEKTVHYRLATTSVPAKASVLKVFKTINCLLVYHL